MKISKIFGILFVLISLNGCALQAVKAGMDIGGAAAGVHYKMTRPDVKFPMSIELEQVPGIAEMAFKDLGINFKESKKAEDGKSIAIEGVVVKEGKNARNLNIRVIAEKITDKATDVKIWANQDNAFGNLRKADLAKLVGDKIVDKAKSVEEAKEEKTASEVKKDLAPEPEKAPAPVKKPAAKKKPVVKKKPASKKQQPATGKGG